VTDEAPSVIRSMLFAEGLIAIDGHGRPTSRLASSWEWDDPGLTLLVHLTPGVRFHDDTPLTAQVVTKILSRRIGKSEGYEAVKSIEARDAQTLLFHLTRPDGFLPSALANTVIVDEKKPDIGTGPFRLIAQSPLLVEAVRNKSYYRGMPGFERITVKGYSTPRAAWAGLMKGDVNLALEINKESVEFLKGAEQFETYSSIQPYYIPLVFNLRNPILARPEVRRAISDAIDRKEIVAQGMRGRGQVADDPIWPLHWAYNPAARREAPSPSAASLRLDTAGLPVRTPTRGQRASRFQLKCMFFNGDPQFERIALLLQRQLAAVGIDLVLEGLGFNEVVSRIQKGQFDSYVFQLTSGRDLTWAYRLWHSPNGALGSVYQNTGYNGADEVLGRLRQARDDDEKGIRVGVADLRQRFYDDVPAVFLAWTEATRAVDARFDIGDGTNPEILANIYQWRPATVQTARR
jgi:peptide/nickel transport system substrate-binding protein